MQGPIRKILEQYDVLFSVGGDLFTLSLPSDIEPMPNGPDAHPSRQRSVGARQELSAEGRDPRRSEGDAAGDHQGAARAHDRRRARRGARAARRREGGDARRARGAQGQGARAWRTSTPVQPLALLARDRRDAAEGRRRDRRDAYRRAPGIRSLIRSDDPQSFFGLRGGGIGWGLPAAIGVKLALPERPVVALVGDGSAMYTCQALWTAAHDRIAVGVRHPQQHAPTASSSSACMRMRGARRAGRPLSSAWS